MVEEIDSIGPVGAVGSEPVNPYGVSMTAPASAPAHTTHPTPKPLAPATAKKSGPPASAQEIQAAVKQANERLATVNKVMELQVDAASGLTIATIRNSQTGEVLEQIPSTDILSLARMLAGWSSGNNPLVDLMA